VRLASEERRTTRSSSFSLAPSSTFQSSYDFLSVDLSSRYLPFDLPTPLHHPFSTPSLLLKPLLSSLLLLLSTDSPTRSTLRGSEPGSSRIGTGRERRRRELRGKLLRRLRG